MRGFHAGRLSIKRHAQQLGQREKRNIATIWSVVVMAGMSSLAVRHSAFVRRDTISICIWIAAAFVIALFGIIDMLRNSASKK
jgi:hypothetical protein